MAGATPLGIARDWSYLQEEEDRVFYFPHLSRLAARHIVGVLFVLRAWTALLLSHPSRSEAPVSGAGRWGRRGMSAPQVGFPRPTTWRFQLASDCCREGPQRRETSPQLGALVVAPTRGGAGRHRGGVSLSGFVCGLCRWTTWGPTLALLLPSWVTLGQLSTCLYLTFLICGLRMGVWCFEDEDKNR